MISVRGGRSVATYSLVRRMMKGAIRFERGSGRLGFFLFLNGLSEPLKAATLIRLRHATKKVSSGASRYATPQSIFIRTKNLGNNEELVFWRLFAEALILTVRLPKRAGLPQSLCLSRLLNDNLRQAHRYQGPSALTHASQSVLTVHIAVGVGGLRSMPLLTDTPYPTLIFNYSRFWLFFVIILDAY